MGAWIETDSYCLRLDKFKSHPMWVRGLKQRWRATSQLSQVVASYVGAWIETTKSSQFQISLPSRILCGCVD